MAQEKIIRTAEFNPRVCPYWLLSVSLILCVTVIGIPFLMLWLPLGLFVTRRYLDRMECQLTTRNLKVRKGMLTRVEKTVPLEKITDLGLVQGPIMRHFGIHQLTVETAGQSSQGALVSLTGIVDVMEFREAVLNQRDSLHESHGKASVPGPDSAPADGTQSALLAEIRDSLLRIEKKLDRDSG